MARQLHFDWPTRVALDPADFFVSPANARAFAQVTAPQDWPGGKLALIGPPGSGKSHLAQMFAQASCAVIVDAAQLADSFPTGTPETLPRTNAALVVEDMERLPPQAEETLFHLHNHLAANGGRLLLTSDRPPARWRIALPDLASRMQASVVASIDDPDDALLAAVLVKLFQDRQIAPAPGLPVYLAARIERSFAAAADIVARLDVAALSQKREVNEALARGLLDKV